MSKREDAIRLLSQYKNMCFGDKLFGGQISMEEIIELLKQSESEERTAETAQNVPNDGLISRKMAIDVLEVFTQKDALGHAPVQIVKALPSAQPEIIYCRDYVFYEGENPCGIVDWWNEASDYCSKGMRREDG